MRRLLPWCAGIACASGIAFPAAADPCKAIPDRGPRPAWIVAGAPFEDLVRYVGDGDSLCVGRNSDPSTWLEVRLSDFDAPELRDTGGIEAAAALRRLALGKHVRCTVVRGRNGRVLSFDRVVAVCRLSGQSLADLMRAAGIAEVR